MDAKLRRIISTLQEHPFVTSSELQKRLDVSERSIRSYIARLNEELAGCATIEITRGAGYSLQVNDSQELLALVDAPADESIPQSPDERMRFLVHDLLYRIDWVTIEMLSSNMYVSRFTISDDLKAVERFIEPYGLSLERRARRGVRVVGSEFARRLCLADLALVEMSRTDSRPAGIFRRRIEAVSRHVDDVMRAHGLRINPMAHRNLLAHITVSVARLEHGHAVSMDAAHQEHAKTLQTYPAACSIAETLGSAFGVTFPPEEIAYIAIHLSGKQSIYDAAPEDSPVVCNEPVRVNQDDAPVIPDHVWRAVTQMVERVKTRFGFDLRGDLELRMNLATHVAPLAIRLRFGMQMTNPLLDEIKNRYALAFAMAVEAATVLADAYGATPTEDETGYLALPFALALDRQKTERVRRNIIIVCATGAGSARLLEHRFRREFGEQLNRIEVCDAQGVIAADLSDIDCIFSTVALDEVLPVPVISVGAFLDESDIPAVRAALREPRADGLGRFFRRDLFFSHCLFASREDAISSLSEALRSMAGADDDIEELVLRREQEGYTSFGNRVAMPHPASPVVDDTTVAVALLDGPVDWAGHDVQAIFMVCVSRNRDRGLQPLYTALARVMGSREAMDELISQQSFDVLLELLNHERRS